jgi:hypothetical protein
MPTTRLLVRKSHLSDARLDTQDDAPLTDGEIRVRIDRFALTANNITYAAFGDAMAYWQFFPTGQEGWGLIPVWGFGVVVQSLHPGIAVGERLYGYWPMASSAVLQPARLSAAGFTDAAAHRVELPAVYNQYVRVAADPFYTPATEDLQALLRPLYTTSWLIDDFLADNDFFGANVMLLSSASSKTAWGTALELSQRAGIEVIGLTSAGNRAYCESLGCYRRVLSYEELDAVDAASACVYIDFAGNAGLRSTIHERFPNLRYSCSIGGTHVDQLGGGKGLPGPRPVLFFAPAQIKKRVGEWGGAEFGRRLVDAWQGLVARAGQSDAPWIVPQRHLGAEAVLSAYALVLGGQGDPRAGHILSLQPG